LSLFLRHQRAQDIAEGRKPWQSQSHDYAVIEGAKVVGRIYKNKTPTGEEVGLASAAYSSRRSSRHPTPRSRRHPGGGQSRPDRAISEGGRALIPRSPAPRIPNLDEARSRRVPKRAIGKVLNRRAAEAVLRGMQQQPWRPSTIPRHFKGRDKLPINRRDGIVPDVTHGHFALRSLSLEDDPGFDRGLSHVAVGTKLPVHQDIKSGTQVSFLNHAPSSSDIGHGVSHRRYPSNINRGASFPER
jgi:hypothetical protein